MNGDLIYPSLCIGCSYFCAPVCKQEGKQKTLIAAWHLFVLFFCFVCVFFFCVDCFLFFCFLFFVDCFLCLFFGLPVRMQEGKQWFQAPLGQGAKACKGAAKSPVMVSDNDSGLSDSDGGSDPSDTESDSDGDGGGDNDSDRNNGSDSNSGSNSGSDRGSGSGSSSGSDSGGQNDCE